MGRPTVEQKIHGWELEEREVKHQREKVRDMYGIGGEKTGERLDELHEWPASFSPAKANLKLKQRES